MSASQMNVGAQTRRRGREESGYVAVTTALLMVILMLMAALAIDVSYFYARGNQVQRAADAAALAGVTRMPQLAQARSTAEESARTNSAFQTADVTVNADPVIDSPRRLKVTVKDTNVPTFFGKILFDHVTVERSSVAEYVKRIPLGSAYNAIGTGNLADGIYTPSGAEQQFWLAINGPCTAKEEGDQIMSLFDGTGSSSPKTAATPVGSTDPYMCDPAGIASATTNTEFNDKGYDYIVNIPCSDPSIPSDRCTTGTLSSVGIQVYDPAYTFIPSVPAGTPPASSRMDRNVLSYQDERFNNVNLSTVFEVYWDHNTPNDKSDDGAALSTACWGPDCTTEGFAGAAPVSCAGTDMWCTLNTVAAGASAGRYRVSLRVLGPKPLLPMRGNLSYGSNGFSLRAVVGGGVFAICSTLTVGAWCPSTSGDESMGVFADAPAAATEAEFFLAQLAPAREFRGKRVQVVLYDPGEGAQSIQILPPPAVVGGARANTLFNWRTWFPGLTAPDRDTGYGWPTPSSTNTLDVSGLDTGNQLGTLRRKNHSKFNGRKLVLEINIPTSYGKDPATGLEQSPLPDDGWWKIRYQFVTGGTRADRTTWTVQLVGDPVHLVHG